MKAIMVALLACVMVPALALAQEGQAAGNLNTITGVNVTGGRVEIVGTKKPNFTTFTMTDPPRLVIDISEAVFSVVKEEITVGNGTITGIRTASYGSDDSAIARVLIGYEREVETDIQTSGNALVVSVAGSGGAPAVAERPAAAAPDTAPAATATTPGATSEQAAVAAQADRQQQEKAAAQSAAAARAEAEAQRQAQARAEADRKAQEEAAKLAAQQAQQAEKQRLQEEKAAKEAAAAAEKQRQQDEARAAADAKKRQQADEKARREAEAQAAADSRKRQQDEARAAAEEKKRQAAEERQARLEEAQAAAEERQAAAEERKRQQAEARQARVAQAETPRRAAPEQGDSAGVSSRGKTMTLVGFKQEPTGSRVFVRTNEPVRYSVTENNRVVVLELENTRIAESNNTRSMNTSFFDTPVASVDADVGPSRTVRVAIKLKEQATYETRQDGNEVSIEFQRSGR